MKGIIRHFVGKVLPEEAHKNLSSPTMQEQALMEELRSAFKRLSPYSVTVSGRSENEWRKNIARLRELVLRQDAREFLRWDVIERTMFIRDAAYLDTELSYLKDHPKWDLLWSNALQELDVGHPPRYPKYRRSSGTLIHHAYHLAQFMDTTGVKIDEIKSVFEFGGGYGSMCRLFHTLGFRGRYIIYDLPEFALLQRYYLNSLGLLVDHGGSGRMDDIGISCVFDISTLQKTITECVDPANAVFVATWSLSETPVKLRERILPLTAGFKSFLIAYQKRFQEVDNVSFFEHWRKKKRDVTWKSWEIQHLRGHFYLMGSGT